VLCLLSELGIRWDFLLSLGLGLGLLGLGRLSLLGLTLPNPVSASKHMVHMGEIKLCFPLKKTCLNN
jgi:hypothetical protein